ncbi:MAG: DUF6414 family protein [Halobacteriota archaeon]
MLFGSRLAVQDQLSTLLTKSTLPPEPLDPAALTVPVYLDNIALFDVLGTIMRGFSLTEEITTQKGKEETAKTSKGGEFSLAPSFFKIGVEGSKGTELSSKANEQTKQTKMLTPEILFNNLREKLIERCEEENHEKPFLRNVVNEANRQSLEYVNHEEVRKLEPGDFVELRGTLRPSSIVDGLSIMIDAMGLVDTAADKSAQPQADPEAPPTPSTPDQSAADHEALEKKVIKGLDQVESRTFYVDFWGRGDLAAQAQSSGSKNPKYNGAVMNLLTSNARDPTMAELSNRTFRVLGKVIHNVPDKDEKYQRPLVHDTRFDICINRLITAKMKQQECKLHPNAQGCSDIQRYLHDINELTSLMYDPDFYHKAVKGINVSPPILEVLPIAIYI